MLSDGTTFDDPEWQWLLKVVCVPSAICVELEWSNDDFDLVWHYVASLLTKIYANKDLNFRSQWPWPLTSRPQICSPIVCLFVTLVQRYVSTKFEVSTAFLFRENRRHRTDGQTDGVQHLVLPPIGRTA